MISGYLQGRRSSASTKGGKMSVAMDNGDFALLLLWLVMRLILPLVMIPTWSLLGAMGFLGTWGFLASVGS